MDQYTGAPTRTVYEERRGVDPVEKTASPIDRALDATFERVKSLNAAISSLTRRLESVMVEAQPRLSPESNKRLEGPQSRITNRVGILTDDLQSAIDSIADILGRLEV